MIDALIVLAVIAIVAAEFWPGPKYGDRAFAWITASRKRALPVALVLFGLAMYLANSLP